MKSREQPKRSRRWIMGVKVPNCKELIQLCQLAEAPICTYIRLKPV